MSFHVTAEMSAAVEQIVRERLAGVAIDRVIVDNAREVDGDFVMDVTVVYNTTPDVSRIKGLARNIWKRIEEGSAFPVLSFRSAAEHSKLTRATA